MERVAFGITVDAAAGGDPGCVCHVAGAGDAVGGRPFGLAAASIAVTMSSRTALLLADAPGALLGDRRKL